MRSRARRESSDEIARLHSSHPMGGLTAALPGLAASQRGLAPRRWWSILPVVFITYSLAYLTRANYGFAAAAGMADDLNITKGTAALIGALFALGYCSFQILGIALAQRFSVKRTIFVCLLAWGSFASLTGVVSSVPALMVVRFGLGVAQAAFFPVMVFYLGLWFSSPERSRANSLLIIGGPLTVLWMSVLSGHLVEAVGWRWMFILEGLPTIIWAFFWLGLTREKPADAAWLTDEEKAAMAERLRQEQAKLKAVKNWGEAFRSRVVLLLCAQYYLWMVSFSSFVLWLPSIIREASSLGMAQTGWLAAAPYMLAIFVLPTVSYFSDRTRKRRPFVAACLLTGATGFFGLYLAGASNFWLSFALLVVAGASMYAPSGAFWSIATEVLPRNAAGGAIALINSVGSLGGFSGVYAIGYLRGQADNPHLAFLLMGGALLSAVLLTPFTTFSPAKKPAEQAPGTS